MSTSINITKGKPLFSVGSPTEMFEKLKFWDKERSLFNIFSFDRFRNNQTLLKNIHEQGEIIVLFYISSGKDKTSIIKGFDEINNWCKDHKKSFTCINFGKIDENKSSLINPITKMSNCKNFCIDPKGEFSRSTDTYILPSIMDIQIIGEAKSDGEKKINVKSIVPGKTISLSLKLFKETLEKGKS